MVIPTAATSGVHILYFKRQARHPVPFILNMKNKQHHAAVKIQKYCAATQNHAVVRSTKRFRGYTPLPFPELNHQKNRPTNGRPSAHVLRRMLEKKDKGRPSVKELIDDPYVQAGCCKGFNHSTKQTYNLSKLH